ncbi:MAG: TatD family deoxyribonuclease [Acidimicrobiia bacterium]|nr:TatD family hydrolase [bacterium]MXX63500.1 TatD family deoxyribonuclease [Acidimicrobiia bacterium]MDE0644251.1 TatD family hydrolase [bacterium]MXZ06676.1 TatD family deoxyribonuclease [Acidimicrobiia bacterium]MYD03353.1 TatD family deoxyribonuclease [Acidimicrobiia bacterium]
MATLRCVAEWVDTHCHLQIDTRSPDVLLNRARDVRSVVVPGIDLESSRAARQIAHDLPGRAFYAAGLHPHHADDWPNQREGLRVLMEKAQAIGETGLDFYRNLAPEKAQIESFVGHHRIAIELSKPLIVHCRDAFRQVYEILESEGSGPWVVLHCWTGGPRWSKRFLELGVTFSFAGPVTYSTGDTIRRGAALVPPERVVVETDTPFLAPEPHRSGPNEPAYVGLTGEALGRIWGMDSAAVARLTSERATDVFGL